jgi:glycosyltransferase involved in cell wall biosynthesis
VYAHEKKENFSVALESVVNQTLIPNEVVIVKDGKIGSALESVIDNFKSKASFPVRIVGTKQNHGLGSALSYGIRFCEYNYIARIDSDDINLPKRFEHQMKFLESHPYIDVLGGQIQEFVEFEGKMKYEGLRIVPRTKNGILKYSRLRNPMNHMTVIFKKSSVQDVGNYRSINGFEDYDLWLRMIKKGDAFANLAEVLVLARTSNGFEDRRGGIGYFAKSFKARKIFFKDGSINVMNFFIGVMIQGTNSLLPKKIRKYVYKHILRG